MSAASAQLERDQFVERAKASTAVAAERKRNPRRREVTIDDAKVKRARELEAQRSAPADIGKVIGASRATVRRYLRMGADEET